MATVLITGANSSMGIPAVGYLLSKHPTCTAVLTVRNDSDDDPNTAKLRAVIAQHPTAKFTIHKLNLASLAAVRKFADEIRDKIAASRLPKIVAAIWIAMSWTLNAGLGFTEDGYERSIAINHIAHFSLTLRLLEFFDPANGRIIFLSSDSHDKSDLQEFRSALPAPENLVLLVHPPPDKEGEVVARGFQRYGLSKLAVVMCMYELRRRIKEHLSSISVLAVDPGGLLDSRAFYPPNVPYSMYIKICIVNWLQPILKYLSPIFRRSADAAKDVIDLALDQKYVGQDGYFMGTSKGESSTQSRNEDMQQRLWDKSLEWSRISTGDTVLKI
ncbi:hypothetical protein BCR34DRAFT_561833 [Clohesyomyces aquaticus]|uniref:3beta-hydroxysteroid 3-dehydrogenase n=1 Tax=Clohesyomyces aquaticus TaxID=1231657 RepID=A0A1Y1ZV19_9PLEO|nr:hypothetical protein BCR34DRAFT_561833 [Clohesyomyces aquaticus]